MHALEPAMRAMRDEYFLVLRNFISATKPGFNNALSAIHNADIERSRAALLQGWGQLLAAPSVAVGQGPLETYCNGLTELYKKYGAQCEGIPRFNDSDDEQGLDARLYGALFHSVTLQGPITLENLELPYMLFLGSAGTSESLALKNSKLLFGFRAGQKTVTFAATLEFRHCSIGGQGVAISKAGRIDGLGIYGGRIASVHTASHSRHDLRNVDSVSIMGTTVDGIADLSNLRVTRMNLDGSTFTDRVNLKNCEIADIHLEATFSLCPLMFGADLPASTHLLEMKLDGHPVGSRGKVNAPDSESARAEYAAVRHLRIECQKRRWTREESLFFAEEQRLERRLNRHGFERLLSLLYDWASVYGSSVSRAALVFVGFNVGFGMLYWILQVVHGFQVPSLIDGYSIGMAPSDISVESGSGQFKDLKASLLAMQNVVNPFGSFSTKALVSVQSVTGLILSAIQVVGSLSLLAVFLLAVRGRFQKTGSGGSAS